MVSGIGGACYDLEWVFGKARGEVVVRYGRFSRVEERELGEGLIEQGSVQ